MESSVLTYQIHSTIKDLHIDDWNCITEIDNPFLDYEFLSALEEGNCLNEGTGWVPQYLTIKNADQKIIAACPLFLKSHSYGEFIFDFQFAQAYHQHGFSYYPKLVSAVPVTPVSGKRILLSDETELPAIQNILNQTLLKLSDDKNLSSFHFLYCREPEADFLTNMGFHKRYSFEYHWYNQGYTCFNDFLMNLNHKSRSQVKKERKEAHKDGIQIEVLTGSDIKDEHIEHCYNFYAIHHHFIHGSPTYLTKDFFYLTRQKMADRMLLILVKKNGKYVAGATNFYKGQGLYGRYWGYTEELKHMHFEVCYYQLIDFAIQNKIQLFEAGAQGEHKIKRGLVPYYTFSAHKFVHPGFHEAIGRYLEAEKIEIDRRKDYYSKRSPYRK